MVLGFDMAEASAETAARGRRSGDRARAHDGAGGSTPGSPFEEITTCGSETLSTRPSGMGPKSLDVLGTLSRTPALNDGFTGQIVYSQKI